jgi:hypothetical protein
LRTGVPHAREHHAREGDIAGLDRALVTTQCRRVRFHDLRHTCASHLLQGTWAPHFTDRALRLEEIREWLGHKSISTTERYAHLCADSLRSRVRSTQVATIEPGPIWTRLDPPVSDDVAQLAGILTTLEPPIRIERTTYGLRNGGGLDVVSGSSVEPSPLRDQILALLRSYASHERPNDVAVVRILGGVLEALKAAPDAVGPGVRRDAK